MDHPSLGQSAKRRREEDECELSEEDETRKVGRLSSPDPSPHSPLIPVARGVPANPALDHVMEEINRRLKIIREGNDDDPTQTPSTYLGHCLRLVAKKNKMEFFHLLSQYEDLDVNQTDYKGSTALMVACQSGSEDIVRLMLANPKYDTHLGDRSGNSCLHYAIKNNKSSVVDLLLADPRISASASDIGNDNGTTPLMMACMDGFAEIAEKLLSGGNVDINCADKRGDTPLLHATVGGASALVSRLLEVPDIKINQANKNGDTALMCAANDGHTEIVARLLQCGELKVNSSNVDKYTSLMCACDKGNKDVVQLLINHPDIDINLKDEGGDTALVWALDKNHMDVAEMLTEVESLEGNDINVMSLTGCLNGSPAKSRDVLEAVTRSLQMGKPRIGLWLLKQRLKTIEDANMTLLEQLLVNAVKEEVKDIAVYLVENSRVDLNTGDKNDALIILASNGQSEDSEDIVKALVRSGRCNLNSVGSSGNTALLRACDNGNQEIALALLSKPETDVNMIGEGETALTCAARRGMISVVEILLEREGLEINHRVSSAFKGKTALIWAGEEGHQDVIRLLVKHDQLEVNMMDDDGYTALIWAADNGHLEAVRELLKHPLIDVNCVDLDGHSALTWAADKGHTELVKLLLDRDLNVNVRDNEGYTPLICAAQMARIDVVDLLLEDGRTDVNLEVITASLLFVLFMSYPCRTMITTPL